MQRNDILWKGLIEDIFPWFIPFFLPEHEYLFNLHKPVAFLDKELQQLFAQEEDVRHPKFVDKLVKVFTTQGDEQWVLIHIEVQGQSKEDFARRMFTYFYRIFDRYGVAVTAIALFTDDNPSFMPDRYEYNFAGTQYVYCFNTYKVLQQDEQALAQSSNPFAIAVLTVLLALKKKRLQEEELLQLKLSLYRQLRSRNFSEQLSRSLFTFLDLYVHFDKPELKRKFDIATNSIDQNSESMGLKEVAEQLIAARAMEKGEEKRNTIFVINMLQSTDFTDEKIAALADVPVAFVQQLRVQVNK
jgi:hypothetical protein